MQRIEEKRNEVQSSLPLPQTALNQLSTLYKLDNQHYKAELTPVEDIKSKIRELQKINHHEL